MRSDQQMDKQAGARSVAAALSAGHGLEFVSDSELVLGAQQGLERAFSTIVDRYHARIYGLVYRMCGPKEAEDLTQDAFLRALSPCTTLNSVTRPLCAPGCIASQ